MAKFYPRPVRTQTTHHRGPAPAGSQVAAPPQPSAPSDQRARAVGEEVLRDLQHSFVAQAAEPQHQPRGQIEGAIRQLVDVRARRAPGHDQARAQAQMTQQPQVGHPASASTSHGSIAIVDPNAKEEEVPGPPVPANAPRIILVGTEVRCWDETDDPGADEIVLGGFCTDPFGRIWPLQDRLIDDDFETGELYEFEGGGEILASMPVLPTAPSWPASYSITLTLVERDCEGFDEGMAGLWSAVQPHVRSRLGAVVGLAAPAVAITGWVVGSFVEWMRDWSADDLIATRVISVELPGLDDASFARAGLLDRQVFRVAFQGNDAHYTIDAYLTRVGPQAPG